MWTHFIATINSDEVRESNIRWLGICKLKERSRGLMHQNNSSPVFMSSDSFWASYLSSPVQLGSIGKLSILMTSSNIRSLEKFFFANSTPNPFASPYMNEFPTNIDFFFDIMRFLFANLWANLCGDCAMESLFKLFGRQCQSCRSDSYSLNWTHSSPR